MKHFILLILVSVIALPSSAQRRKKGESLPLIVFQTLDEERFDKGQNVGDFIGYDWTLGKLTLLTFIDKRNSRRHSAKDLWGFKVGDQTYRIVEARAYRVLDKGNGVYYENGFAHMNMQMDDEGESDVELGSYSFLSKSLDSEIVEIPSRKAEKFFETDGSLAAFLECIKKLKPHKTEKIRECMHANN
ncbi:MAG: hypothetical protein ACI85F_002879 [Bacteroidia bacterium]|jgi:hypothetical protein